MYLYPTSPPSTISIPKSQNFQVSSKRYSSLSLLSVLAGTMKQSFLSVVLLLFFLVLISSSHFSARFIANKQGKDEVELSQITDMEDVELMNQLMGVETCDSRDDECLKRRIISEAHLDYIYTQHHKP